MRPLVLLAMAFVLALSSGCSSGPPRVKVTGQLVKGGSPVKPDPNRSLRVIFVPEGVQGAALTTYPALITTETETFEVGGRDGNGIPLGRYRVRLASSDPSPSARIEALLDRFGTDKSPIVVEVKDATPLTIDLDSYK
jgi:hypothetical protein